MLDGREVGVPQDRQVGGDRRGDTLDHEFVERPDRAGDGDLAVAAPHDQLADEVVVVLADLVARLVAGVEAHAEAVGGDQLGDRAGGGQELAAGRVLGVDPDLDRVAAAGVDLVLGHRQRFARGDADLPLDEVDTGDHLGHGVLDLQAGVHLEEEELAVLVDELDGAGVVVADRLGGLDRGLAHRFSTPSGSPGAGASSISFWWRRCAEQSRVEIQTQLPCWSPTSWISTWRGQVR